MATKTQRKIPIQVSPSLNLVLTKYATEQGITKAEAADRVFNILYPKGTPSEAETLESPGPGGDEESAGDRSIVDGLEEEREGGEGISKELEGTVKDLRAVQTIRALQSGFNEKDDDGGKLTVKDAFEMKKFEAMFSPKGPAAGTDALDATFQKYVAPLQEQMKALEGKISEQRVADAEKRASEAEKKLEERDQIDQRQAEMAAIVGPIQEQMKMLESKLVELGENLKADKGTPESDELKAINTVAAETRNLVQKLGTMGGSPGNREEGTTVADTLDQLIVLSEKLKALQGKFTGSEGDFDWRAAAISTIGEVTKEGIQAYRETNTVMSGQEEEQKIGKEQKKEEVTNQIVLRRVYDYAVKKIAEGNLKLDPFTAGKELNLSPNQVWWAIDQLQKKKLLTTGQSPASKGDEHVEHGEQGLTQLPPGVEG